MALRFALAAALATAGAGVVDRAGVPGREGVGLGAKVAGLVDSFVFQDELGSGGYGFVMTARHREDGHEVAVKFIIKDKVPDHAWWEDDTYGRVPTEVMLLSLVNHENIVKCLDLFEDEVYFYLVSRDPRKRPDGKHGRF